MAREHDAMASPAGAGTKERAAYDLSVRTYDEAAQVAALLKTGAGGGGLACKGQAPTFNNGRPRTLTTADVPLGNKPIKRAAMTHVWCAHAVSIPSTLLLRGCWRSRTLTLAGRGAASCARARLSKARRFGPSPSPAA